MCSLWSWDRVVGIVTRMWVGQSGVWIPAVAADFSHLQNVQTSYVRHPASYSMGTGVLSQRYSSWGMKLTIHLHLLLWLRMSGAISLPLPYASIAWTGVTLPLSLPLCSLSTNHSHVVSFGFQVYHSNVKPTTPDICCNGLVLDTANR
jgi:hypothetical protein